MSPLPEQFSEASKLQLEAQFNFLSTFTGKAFESAEKIIALNFDTSRASLEKSSALVRQLIAIKDPRDLFALTKQTQFQFDSVLSYGRQLFGIASGVATAAVESAVDVPALALAAPAPAPAAAPAPVATKAQAELPIAVQAPEVVVAKEPAADPAPVVEARPIVEAQPIAEPTAVAKAVGTPEAPKPSAASFPVPSSSQPIAVAPVKPVDAEPPHAPVSGTPSMVARKPAGPSARAARKK
jgi:phasin family protein